MTRLLMVLLASLVTCFGARQLTRLGIYEELKQALSLDRGVKVPYEEEVTLWLDEIDEQLRLWQEAESLILWNYDTDITDENAKKVTLADVQFSKWKLEVSAIARAYLKHTFNSDVNRKLRKLAMGDSPKSEETSEKLASRKTDLSGIYATATVEKDGRQYALEPDLVDIMATSHDPNELLWAWKGWRDATGPKMRPLYLELVDYMNEGARDNAYPDYGAYWRDVQFMDTHNLKELCESLWKELEPLYMQLHAYVRRKLILKYSVDYPELKLTDKGTIPAHLLGNMWAQTWQNIFDIVVPYPNAEESDGNVALIKQDYDVMDMVHLADEFYQSMGLSPMTQEFWDNSIMVKPNDGRGFQCHASAFDIYNGHDFRIKMCTEVNMHDFETIHHEMGHVQYFMEYSDQPAIYREGANCAFHEAIGDTISLSVMTDTHLTKIGLNPKEDKRSNKPDENKRSRKDEKDINSLMKMALEKIAFLPFGLLIDRWRWDLFNGTIDEKNLNSMWWKYRKEYQGLSPPVQRTEADFDPGAKYHVPANSPYICYFISFISQFQFYEALCAASEHQGPLHQCDFYQSKAAGKLLGKMLRMGSSRPWQDAMQTITGQREISTSSIREYFRPLMKWLEQQNQGEHIGWE